MKYILGLNNLIIKVIESTFCYLKSSVIIQNFRLYQNVHETNEIIRAMKQITRTIKHRNKESNIVYGFYNSNRVLWSLEKLNWKLFYEKRNFHLSRVSFENKPPIIKEFVEYTRKKQKIEKENISIEDAKLLDRALAVVIQNKKIREEVEELKKKLEVVSDQTHNIKKNKVAEFLHKKLNSIVSQLDKDLKDLEKKHLAEHEKKNSKNKVNSEEENGKNLIKITEIIEAIKELQKETDEIQLLTLTNLLNKIDISRNGLVSVKDVIIIVEAIISNNTKLYKTETEKT